MKPELHIVLGKGGVGKSTVSAALALALAHDGRSVLAIELDAPGGLCRALHVEPEAAGDIVRSPLGVSVAYFSGAAALAEYLTRVVRLPMLHTVLDHPLYRAFVGAAPGLGELMVMGKVRDELVLQKQGRKPRWDAVVLDAGASGHALEHLRMPKTAAVTFASGRVHREAKKVHGVLADPGRTRVHVVATPEEMPIAEAMEAVARLRHDLELPVGQLLVNQCREIAPDGVEPVLAQLASLPVSDPERRRVQKSVVVACRRALGWERIQEAAIAALERDSGLRARRLPALPAQPLGLPELRQLAELLTEVAA